MATTEHDLLKKVMQKKSRPGLAGGGMAKRQGQGLIRGSGTGTSDSVPIDLPSGAKIAASDGEFIVPSDTTAKVGAHNLQALVDATHTPVATKKRFGYADGGNARFDPSSPDFGRGPVNRAGAYFGSGAVRADEITGANPSPQIQQGGLASRPYGSLTSSSGSDTSLALPRTAVPGITPISQYGGMDATASLEDPLPQTASASPAPAIRGRPVSSAALAQLATPVQRITGNGTGFPSFGYANGGRVKLANGGIPGYTVEELPFEEIDYRKAPQPGAEPYPPKGAYTVSEPAPAGATQRVTGPIEPKFTPNPDGTMSPKQMAFEMAQEKSAAGTKTLTQKAGEVAEGIGGKIRGLFGGAKGATNVTPSKLTGALRFGLAAGVPIGAFNAATESPEEVNKFNAITPAPKPVQTALRYLQHIGDAATLGVAGMAGRGLAGLADDKDPGGSAVKGFFGEDAPAKAAPIAKVTPKFEVLSSPNLAPSTQNEGLPSFAGDDDLRRAVVQANRPDTDYHNLGDYGAPGTRIFGRASQAGGKMNDFAGVGGGVASPSNGVDFGLKPGDVEAYRTGAMGSGAGAQFGGLRAPEYYSSPEAQRLNNTASQMAERLAAMKPGEPGRKRLTAQLAAVNETASRLQSADQTVNAHNMSSFGHAASMQQHMLSMNNNLTVAQGQLGMKKAEIGANWQIEHAKLTNQMNEFAHQHGKDAISRNEKVIENYVNSLFPEDKEKQAQYGGMLKVMAAAKSFDRGDKKLSLHELDAHDLSKTLGSITQQASIALQQGANKHPMNIETGQATRPATFWESLYQGARNGTPFGSVYKHLRYGQVATDDGDTVVPNFELGSAPHYRQR